MLDVENAFGSGFGDTLTGANGANLLKGMAGNDCSPAATATMS